MEQLNEHKKYLAFIEIIFAIFLATVLIPIGFLYSVLIEPFFHKSLKKIVNYFKNFFYGIWFVITHTLHSIAFSIDVLGNIITGELVEKLVTKERATWFGKKDHSISQSMGYLEFNKKLNNFGQKFNKLLSIIFGENHSINAFKNYKK